MVEALPCCTCILTCLTCTASSFCLRKLVNCKHCLLHIVVAFHIAYEVCSVLMHGCNTQDGQLLTVMHSVHSHVQACKNWSRSAQRTPLSTWQRTC